MNDYTKLIELATQAKEKSYSPYSKFCVGACVLTRSGKTYLGANVENASFGATICAERNAIMSAILSGEKQLDKIAIVSSSGDFTYPCGICRQTLLEFCDENFEIIVAKDILNYKVYKLGEIVPFGFCGDDIKWERL